MLDGIILLWFLLTALSVGFVAIDIRQTLRNDDRTSRHFARSCC